MNYKESDPMFSGDLFRLTVKKYGYNEESKFALRRQEKHTETSPSGENYISSESNIPNGQSSPQLLKEDRLMIGVFGGLGTSAIELLAVAGAIGFGISGEIKESSIFGSVAVAVPALYTYMIHLLNSQIHDLQEKLQDHN